MWHREEQNDFRIDLALVGASLTVDVSKSWVNGSHTKYGGSHQTALTKALKRAGWTPEVSLVHVVMLQPEFAGPTKEKLWAPSLEGPLEAAFYEALNAKTA